MPLAAPAPLQDFDVFAPQLAFLTDQEHEFADALLSAGLGLGDTAFVLALMLCLEDFEDV